MPTPRGAPARRRRPGREGRLQRLSGRVEDHERLVPAQLDDAPLVSRDRLADELREGRRELCGRLVAVLLRVARVAADVGDQEGAELRGP